MKTFERREELQRHLVRHGHSNLNNLADLLNVSKRTIIRDLHALRDSGLIIDSDSGPGGGVYLEPSSNVLKPSLMVNEVIGLILTIEFQNVGQNIPFSSHAKTGLRKIENSLPPKRLKELRNFLKRILIAKKRSDISDMEDVQFSSRELLLIEDAFSNCKNLGLKYQDKNRVLTRRTIEPQGILFMHPVWYVIGFDIEKTAFRIFRADRIQSIKILHHQSFHHKPIDDVRSNCPFETKD